MNQIAPARSPKPLQVRAGPPTLSVWVQKPAKRAPRKPREDVVGCTKKILDLMKTCKNEPVTAGWICDRDLGFKLCTIEVCLRMLVKKGSMSRNVPNQGGFQWYVWPAQPMPAMKRYHDLELDCE